MLTAFLLAAALPMSGEFESTSRDVATPAVIAAAPEQQPVQWDAALESVFYSEAVEPVVEEPAAQSWLVRGQSPGYDEDPSFGGDLNQQPFLGAPAIGQAFPWPAGGATTAGTPLLDPNGMSGGPQPAMSVYGANGPQPVRFGWSVNGDVGYLAPAKTSSGSGADDRFGILEVNTEARYTIPLPTQWIFSIAPQFNLRLWEGPTASSTSAVTTGAGPTLTTTTTTTTVGLPADVYRVGGDVKLVSPAWGPYTVELGFTPSLNTDFQQTTSRDAWIFDGRGALIVQASPQWMFVLGATFWNRVKDRVLPYAGVVYTPNDWLQVRALFPRADVNIFLGTPWGIPQWLYVAGEYHIEAYQVQLPVGTQTSVMTTGGTTTTNTSAMMRDQLEIEDWRVLGGIRSDYYGVTSFLEAGWVLGRHVRFANSTAPSDFDISSGFIARFGLRY